MVTLKGSSGYFECQGHNSLNSGPIFKILVPKHIYFRPIPYQMLIYRVMFILSFVLKLEIIGTQSTINI